MAKASLLENARPKVKFAFIQTHRQEYEITIMRRLPGEGVLHHFDRGSQYAANDYQQLLNAHKMVVRMSRKGDCYDNAVMESFRSTLKAEYATAGYASRSEARRSIFEYIEVWYNRQKAFSAGVSSPEAYEQRYFESTTVSSKSE